jgi:hypothetical protein
MTEVVNLYADDLPKNWRSDSSYVYIGRGGKGLSDYWGNPFPIEKEDRAECIRKYLGYLLFCIANDPTIIDRIRALKDKRLVCFCSPKLCHGNILALLAETL